jgi:PilZ domain
MAESTRRSTRIPKQVAILLVGSDFEGRVFSEKTKTVVLSRHGAGIVSEYKLSAEQELVIRVVETNKEAEVRVVGQLAAQSGVYTYGVAFLDPNLDLWGLEFAPATEAEKAARRTLLECSSCKGREIVDQSDLESDVFAINKNLMRYCKKCGSSTLWKQPSVDGGVDAAGKAEGADAAETPDFDTSPRIPAPAATLRPMARETGSEAGVAVASDSNAADSTPSASPVRRENRRKHVRTKVNFKACVRYQNFADDIVTCEDMSRGGLRFKSRQRYVERAKIEIAAPYSAGTPPIFVTAQIVFVQELRAERMFRYGIAYLHTLDRR